MGREGGKILDINMTAGKQGDSCVSKAGIKAEAYIRIMSITPLPGVGGMQPAAALACSLRQKGLGLGQTCGPGLVFCIITLNGSN